MCSESTKMILFGEKRGLMLKTMKTYCLEKTELTNSIRNSKAEIELWNL
jgi:hypothetical protein